MLRTASRVAAAVLSVLLLSTTPAFAQLTTGNIEGRVTDAETGKPVPGVTVSVSGPALPGEQTEFTDGTGHYLVTQLPPGGDYVVRYFYSNVKVERPGVTVTASKTISISVKMPKVQALVIPIIERPPVVDVANTNVSTTIDTDFVRNVPIQGRTFDAVLAFTPGASTDPTGYVFGGATGPENSFLIDGMNTTNPAFGLVGTQLSLEFIKETEIITGGYGAEFGRATGGLVNVVTKSGSNEMHGGAWFNYAPFSLDPKTIARLGEAIAVQRRGGVGGDATNFLDHAFDFGFDLGGPIVKDRIWFYMGFAPTFVTQSYDRIIRARVAGTEAEAAAGGAIDPNVQCPSYLSSQDAALCAPSKASAAKTVPLTDLGAGNAKYNNHFESNSRLYNYIAKLTFRINDDNNVTLSYIGSPSTFNGVFFNPRDPSSYAIGPANFNTDPKVMQFEDNQQVHDVVARFVSKLLDHRLQLDVMVGFHYEHSNIIPNAAGLAQGSVIDQRTSPLTRYEDINPCAPTVVKDNPGSMGTPFNPCPITNYQASGFGFINELTNKRFTVGAALTYFLKLGGTHAIKLGGDFEDNVYTDHRGYTGGAQGGSFIVRSDGSVTRKQFGTVVKDANGNDMAVLTGSNDPALNGYTAETTTLNYSLYLRDSWNFSFLPGFTLNAGVRWEAQQVKDINGVTQIGIYDNVAPRVGFAYDFTGKGRSKIYASYGRFYESIPLDINDRQFSGEGVTQRLNSSSCQSDANGKVNPSSCVFPPLQRDQLNGGTFGVVSPSLHGQYTNEVIAGLQYDIGWDVVLGAAYIHRDLGAIIEDVSPDGGVNYIIANPGAPTDSGVVADLQKKINASSDPAEKAKLSNQLALYQQVQSFEKPRRDYNAFQLTATKRFSNNFLVLASYTYGRTLGNYPGLFSPSNGQLDPNISSQYDLKELLINRNGPLPSDRPHNLKITGAYSLPIGAYGFITLGANFFMLSGQPIEVLGFNPSYGPSETFILPRGSGGRTPTLYQLDLHLGWARQFGKQMRAELTWDIFNVLNLQEVTQVDQEYTFDSVSAIPNGTHADLALLKTNTGAAPHLNPNYGQPTAYQAPLSMRFGARISF